MSDDYGMQIRNDNDTVIWDSRNSGGGVVADIISLPANDTTNLIRTYPQFAGRNIEIIPLTSMVKNYATVDTNLGYPRFQSGSANVNGIRRLIVSIY